MCEVQALMRAQFMCQLSVISPTELIIDPQQGDKQADSSPLTSDDCVALQSPRLLGTISLLLNSTEVNHFWVFI